MSPQVETIRILQDDGSYRRDDLPALSDAQLKELYEWMVFVRLLDQRAINLQRQGRMGTYPPVGGQEAAQVGSAYALNPEDWLFPSYRENAAVLVHGLPPEQMLLTWMGREEGMCPPEGVNVFPFSIPISSQVPHAVGMAWAAKLRGDRRVAIVYFGDGGTSEGDFHEGANFAGVFRAPVVFFCQNNLYAISVPLSRQTATETIAQKAIAYGFPGVRVDGNDV
ncbi:MAG TPA: thiamine pyrophosphate-dependent enzyme, partial [Bacillota bacterium]